MVWFCFSGSSLVYIHIVLSGFLVYHCFLFFFTSTVLVVFFLQSVNKTNSQWWCWYSGLWAVVSLGVSGLWRADRAGVCRVGWPSTHTHTYRAFKNNSQDYLVLAAAGLGLFACLTGERRLTREDGNTPVTLNWKTSQHCHQHVGLRGSPAVCLFYRQNRSYSLYA